MKCRQNYRSNSIHIFSHFIVPKPEHAKACSINSGCSHFVMQHRLGVLPTINLNDQRTSQTSEINNEFPDYKLPPEFITIEIPQSQMSP